MQRRTQVTRLKSALMRAVFLLTANCLLLTVGAPAQTPQAQSTAQAPDFQAIISRQASLVSEFEINGMKVVVKRREGSQTVAADLFIRGGVENFSRGNAGIESLMLNVATEATTNFPRDLMRKELSRTGTVIGGGAGYDYSALSMISTRAHFDRSWELFADVAMRPSFTKEDFALVQERVLASLRDDGDTPDSYLQQLQEQVAFADHPYRNNPEGTVDSISRMTANDLRTYHKGIMQTSQLLLVIVGDLDAAQLKARITASLGKLPRGNYKPESPPPFSFSTSTVDVTTRELPTNYIQGMYSAPALTSPDIYPMRVASSMLRDRVFEEVRVKRNLSYAPNAFLRTQSANIGGIYVTAVDANQAVKVMLNEITRLQREPIEPLAITGVVAQYLTEYYMGQETNAAQAAELGLYEMVGGGWRNSLLFLGKLQAVTPADVQRVAQKYMRNIRFVVLGNPARVDKSVFTGQPGN